MRGEGDVAEKYQLKSEQELISKFLKESVGLYVQQKSREDFGASRAEVIEGVKETFTELLNGLPDYTKNLDSEKVNKLLSTMKENLDSYIEKIDQELTKDRDAYMANHPGHEPNEAMYIVGHKSRFGKMAEQLLKDKDTGWKELANFFKELGIPKLTDFFEKKNEESKMVNQAKSMTQVLKVFGVQTTPSLSRRESTPISTPHTKAGIPEKSR